MTTRKLAECPQLNDPVEVFEAELVEGDLPRGAVAQRFIHTLDASNFEERFGRLSPRLLEVVVQTAKNNVLTFDAIIAEITNAGGYAGGWVVLRDWARRQPWLEEETKRVAEILARLKAEAPPKSGRLSFSEQGRMLGILRVHLMRASTDDEREAIRKEISELEVEFRRQNRDEP